MDFIAATFKASSFATTLNIIQQIMAISLIPFYTKFSDAVGRAQALTGALFFYLVGYVIQATSTSFEHLAGGQIVYGLGADGVGTLTQVLIADATLLIDRGLVLSLTSLPGIVNVFIAGGLDRSSDHR